MLRSATEIMICLLECRIRISAAQAQRERPLPAEERPGWRSDLLLAHGPAQPRRVGRVVVRALHHVLSAALVKAEDLVVEVEAIGGNLESPRDLVTGLGVEL